MRKQLIIRPTSQIIMSSSNLYSTWVASLGLVSPGGGRRLMVSPYFVLQKWRQKWAVVSSPLIFQHRLSSVFFLNSATKKLMLFGCHLLDGVTQSGTHPSDATTRPL